MENQEIAQHIATLANESFHKEGLYLVDVLVKGHPNSRKIIVLLDADGGLNIDDCSILSKALSSKLDEVDFVSGKYTLEVSSPGLDHPLKLKRQYPKNVGRSLKVITIGNETIEGVLKEVTSDEITLELIKNKKAKNKTGTGERTIPFGEIEKTFVLVTF
ncbi:MAG TPA: ribosome assembly cofactor RimP [Cytophagales bacterium]|jgi:ribosome maturation factor RimP|nr:ribosome assembly cofactor RimP [Cytophagales bacterium]